MGLGKTLEALALMCHTKERGLTDAPYLVVAPTSVVGNWASECHRFAPALEVVTVTETEKRRGAPARRPGRPGADLVITSYSLFRLEYDGYAAVELGRPVPRRGPVRQEPAVPDLPAGQAAAGALQGVHDRHAHREQPDGAVVAAVHRRAGPVRQPRAVRRVLPGAHRAECRRRAPGPAAAADPAPHAAPDQGAGGERPPRQAGAGPRARPQPPAPRRSTRPTCSGSARRSSACSAT